MHVGEGFASAFNEAFVVGLIGPVAFRPRKRLVRALAHGVAVGQASSEGELLLAAHGFYSTPHGERRVIDLATVKPCVRGLMDDRRCKEFKGGLGPKHKPLIEGARQQRAVERSIWSRQHAHPDPLQVAPQAVIGIGRVRLDQAQGAMDTLKTTRGLGGVHCGERAHPQTVGDGAFGEPDLESIQEWRTTARSVAQVVPPGRGLTNRASAAGHPPAGRQHLQYLNLSDHTTP